MIIVVMGVSGSGKSTVGERLARHLGWPFYDGDDFHPAANVEKMSRGIPLTDEDRAGWLASLADLIRRRLAEGGSAVLACSALKQRYRDQLRVDASVHFVYLKGEFDLIRARMHGRRGHYMRPELLASQFAALEEPRDALTLDIARPPDELINQILAALQLQADKQG